MGWITLDNASNNDTFMETLGELLETRDIEFDVVERRIRCVDNHYLMVIAILYFLKVLPTCSQLSV